MKTKKNYVSPKCLVEVFVANEYVATCDPKFKDEWEIVPGYYPLAPNTKFYLDKNDDGYLTGNELKAVTTHEYGTIDPNATYKEKHNGKIVNDDGTLSDWKELVRMGNSAQQWLAYEPGATRKVRNFS